MNKIEPIKACQVPEIFMGTSISEHFRRWHDLLLDMTSKFNEMVDGYNKLVEEQKKCT